MTQPAVASTDLAPARAVPADAEPAGIEPPPEAAAAEPLPLPLPGPLPVSRRASASPWSGSVWLFERAGGGGTGGLASGGQLGGGQAGIRIARRVTRAEAPIRLDMAGRVSTALHGRQTEAAVGADLYPVRALPVRLSVERRIAIDRGGRDAWSLAMAGGFSRSGLPGGFDADGYAQAGVVGARSRDGFIDGALRVARPIAIKGGGRLLVGAGLWGAAQPGVERLDLGPRVALAAPVGAAVATLAVEGRLRVAGDARPGSGIALVAGIDF